MAMMLEISSAVLARVAAEAAADPAHEICGLLLGNAAEVTEAVPCRNVAADRRTRFEIDPAQLLGAHRAARQGASAVIGCYHSHPGGTATPSPRDAADAAPDGTVWLLIAETHVTAWRAVEAGALHGRFDRLGLRVVAPSAK